MHDGQQRLITLSLLIAAMRDNFASTWHNDDDMTTEEHLSKMVMPTKGRKKDVLRIVMRPRDGQLLGKLLNSTGDFRDLPIAKERQEFSAVDSRIAKVYEHFFDRIRQLGKDKSEDLLDYLEGDVFLLVSTPKDAKMARNFVVGQNRGKNFEPVDEMKGLVCFAHTADEVSQDNVLNKWQELEDTVGRKCLEASCIALSQGELREAARRNGETDLFAKYLRKATASRNCDGEKLFDDMIQPAAEELKALREGRVDYARGIRNPPSFSFLDWAATEIPTSKEIEPVVLAILMKLRNDPTKSETEFWNGKLNQLERVALWMMLAKPKLPARRKKCFHIMQHLDDSAALQAALELSDDDKAMMRQNLDKQEFGKTTSGRKVATALLLRLNEHQLLENNQATQIQAMESTLQVEHVLPQKYSTNQAWTEGWDAAHAIAWVHRLGNLALLNQKTNSKISNGSFSSKKPHLGESAYPLTRESAKVESWNAEAVARSHLDLCRLAFEVWRF